jgi:hypothetical protein
LFCFFGLPLEAKEVRENYHFEKGCKTLTIEYRFEPFLFKSDGMVERANSIIKTSPMNVVVHDR